MANTTSVSITVTHESAAWLDRIAAEHGITREVAFELVRENYELRRGWAELQREGQAAAERLGIESEDDLEAFLDAIEED